MKSLPKLETFSYWTKDTTEESIIAEIEKSILDQSGNELKPIKTIKSVDSNYLTVATTRIQFDSKPEITLIHTRNFIRNRRGNSTTKESGEKTIVLQITHDINKYLPAFINAPQEIIDMFVCGELHPRNESWLQHLLELNSSRAYINSLPKNTLFKTVTTRNNHTFTNYYLSGKEGNARCIYSGGCDRNRPFTDFNSVVEIDTSTLPRREAKPDTELVVSGFIFSKPNIQLLAASYTKSELKEISDQKQEQRKAESKAILAAHEKIIGQFTSGDWLE